MVVQCRDDLGTWKCNDNDNGMVSAGEKFLGQHTANITCLTDDFGTYDQVSEVGNNFQHEAHGLSDYDRGIHTPNRDYDGRNGVACSNSDIGADQEGKGMRTGMDGTDNGKDDDEREQGSSFAKLRRRPMNYGVTKKCRAWTEGQWRYVDGKGTIR